MARGNCCFSGLVLRGERGLQLSPQHRILYTVSCVLHEIINTFILVQ